MTLRSACGWILIVHGLVAVTPLSAADDDWLGVPAAPDAWLRLWGGGAAQSDSAGIEAALAMGPARLYASAVQTQTVDQSITLQDDRWSVGLGSNPAATGSMRLDLLSHGEEGAAEFVEYWLELSGYFGPWDMSVRAMNGTAELFLRNDLPLPRARRRSVEIDTTALGGTLAYLIGRLRFDVGYARYWYDEDLGVIAEYPLLELALGPVTDGHSATLPEEDVGCGVSLAQGLWDLGLRYQQSRSALDDERLESAHLSVYRQMDSNLGIGGRTILPLDGSDAYGELILDVAF